MRRDKRNWCGGVRQDLGGSDRLCHPDVHRSPPLFVGRPMTRPARVGTEIACASCVATEPAGETSAGRVCRAPTDARSRLDANAPTGSVQRRIARLLALEHADPDVTVDRVQRDHRLASSERRVAEARTESRPARQRHPRDVTNRRRHVAPRIGVDAERARGAVAYAASRQRRAGRQQSQCNEDGGLARPRGCVADTGHASAAGRTSART